MADLTPPLGPKKKPGEYSTNPNTVRARQRQQKLTPRQNTADQARAQDKKAVNRAFKLRSATESFQSMTVEQRTAVLAEIKEEVMSRRRAGGQDYQSKMRKFDHDFLHPALQDVEENDGNGNGDGDGDGDGDSDNGYPAAPINAPASSAGPSAASHDHFGLALNHCAAGPLDPALPLRMPSPSSLSLFTPGPGYHQPDDNFAAPGPFHRAEGPGFAGQYEMNYGSIADQQPIIPPPPFPGMPPLPPAHMSDPCVLAQLALLQVQINQLKDENKALKSDVENLKAKKDELNNRLSPF